MLYKYNELRKIKEFDQHIKIKEALISKKIFKLENGLYSDNKYNNDLEIIMKLYDDAIFIGESAYFYHGLTDVIPRYYYLNSKRKARKIYDNRVKQSFSVDEYFAIGKSTIIYNGIEIAIYDKERMLIELIRNKNNLSFEMYKEIIENYRKIVNQINWLKIDEYLDLFKNGDNLFKTIQLEVM